MTVKLGSKYINRDRPFHENELPDCQIKGPFSGRRSIWNWLIENALIDDLL